MTEKHREIMKMEQSREYILRENVKKSALHAESGFDYKKLAYKRAGLIACEIKEEKEELEFTYNISGWKSVQEIRSEKKLKKLLVLLSAAELLPLYEEYRFCLSDENLYYDRSGQTAVLRRDIYARGEACNKDSFLEGYKALIGFVMQKKYSYMDYFDGGQDLFKKDKFLAGIAPLQTMEEIMEYLEQAYEEEDTAIREKRVEVGKNWHRLMNWYLLVSFLIIVGAGAFILYLLCIENPRKDAMLAADNAYLESDYVRVIDSLENVDMRYMDKYKKYILAVAYVKGENLTDEQKENILSTLNINGDEKLKEYWIYLGRLNTDEAENIALQRSDDQLLLYSYLTEKSLLEKNTEMSGEEKTAQLAELENKIEELAEMYETEE